MTRMGQAEKQKSQAALLAQHTLFLDSDGQAVVVRAAFCFHRHVSSSIT